MYATRRKISSPRSDFFFLVLLVIEKIFLALIPRRWNTIKRRVPGQESSFTFSHNTIEVDFFFFSSHLISCLPAFSFLFQENKFVFENYMRNTDLRSSNYNIITKRGTASAKLNAIISDQPRKAFSSPRLKKHISRMFKLINATNFQTLVSFFFCC